MKNKDELVKKEVYYYGYGYKIGTLQELMNKYNTLTEEINELEEDITPMLEELELRQARYPKNMEDALILYSIESTLYHEHKLSDGYVEFDFVHQHNFYDVITYLINGNKEKSFEKRGVNLQKLRGELVLSFKELREFLQTTDEKALLDRKRDELISRINFNIPSINTSISHPLEGHCFIDFGDELKCVYCDFSTKDYDLTKEELEFIKLCARKRELVLENITEDDLPLIELIRQEQEKEIKKRERIMLDEDDELVKTDKEYDYYEDLENTGFCLQLRINDAHNIDSRVFTNEVGEVVNNPQYLDLSKGAELMAKTHESLYRTKNLSDEAKCKEDLLRKLNVKRYEIKILSSGKTPKEIYRELESEEEKEYFIMAYGNLRDFEYREKSGYFKDKSDACSYTCTTADYEINKRLLKIR